MLEKVLVAYATRYGSTQEVAQAVAATLKESGFTVDLRVLREVRKLEGYQAVVLGAPLFMFHWHKDALGFLGRQQAALMKMPVAIFVLGPVHEPHDDAEWKSSWEQLEKSWRSSPGWSLWRWRCSAAGTTPRSWASRSRCLPAKSLPATCATGRRSAAGRARWGRAPTGRGAGLKGRA